MGANEKSAATWYPAYEFTPSVGQVRSHYVFDQTDSWDAERGAAFDRWLARHDAEKQAEALEEAAEHITDDYLHRALVARAAAIRKGAGL